MGEAGELIRAIEHAQKTERERIASMVAKRFPCLNPKKTCHDPRCGVHTIAAMIRKQEPRSGASQLRRKGGAHRAK